MDSAGFYKVQPWHIFKRVLWGFRVYKGYFHVFMSSTRIWQDFYGHTWLNLPITKSHSFEAITFGSPSQSYQGRCVCVCVSLSGLYLKAWASHADFRAVYPSVCSLTARGGCIPVRASIYLCTNDPGWMERLSTVRKASA